MHTVGIHGIEQVEEDMKVKCLTVPRRYRCKCNDIVKVMWGGDGLSIE